jgi:hypothetical protein
MPGQDRFEGGAPAPVRKSPGTNPSLLPLTKHIHGSSCVFRTHCCISPDYQLRLPYLSRWRSRAKASGCLRCCASTKAAHARRSGRCLSASLAFGVASFRSVDHPCATSFACCVPQLEDVRDWQRNVTEALKRSGKLDAFDVQIQQCMWRDMSLVACKSSSAAAAFLATC